MPKIHGTRAQKARELMRLVNSGPVTLDAEAAERYRLWSDTWVKPLLFELIAELRDPPEKQSPK